MERYDLGMPFLLKYENVARYSEGVVRILDRRVYPKEVSFVTCRTYQEVAEAIRNLVTQSAGPYTALGMGMALANFQAKNLGKAAREDFLREASASLASSRPTQRARYEKICDRLLKLSLSALERGEDPVQRVMEDNLASLNRRYRIMTQVAQNLLDLIPEGGSILTQCYGETVIGGLIKLAKEEGKTFKVYCAETRPFMQGARLTASCFVEEGFDTTILADNMVAAAFDRGLIDLFTSAADCICEDGSVVNKVGTLQIAILAKYFERPYYVTGIPDAGIRDLSQVEIEQKDPEEVLSFQGIRYTPKGAKAIYPAFDKTPASLVNKIITDKGVFSPENLKAYFEVGNEDFY